MRSWTFSLLLLAAGCPNVDGTDSTDTSDSDTTGETEDSPDDTDPDSEEELWDTGPDTDPDTDTDVEEDTSEGDDTGFNPGPDTSACPFGEVEDCDGICYPRSYIGDGTCDDGANFASNFDCVQFDFDDGDCADTDTPLFGGCSWEMVITTRANARDIGWDILTPDGRVVHRAQPGTYPGDNRIYTSTVDLPDGDYRLLLVDDSNNGWGRDAGYELRSPINGTVLSEGTLATGGRSELTFAADCSLIGTPPECGDVRLDLQTQNFGGEISWDIVDDANQIVAQGAPMVSNTLYTQDLSLGEGNFHFRLYDAFGDGWYDGAYAITDRVSGQNIGEGTLRWGDYAAHPFSIACTPGFDEMTDDTDQPLAAGVSEITCDSVSVAIRTGDDGHEMGWSLLNDAGVVLAEQQPGAYTANTTYYVDVPVRSGPYTFELTDAGGDGWSGGLIQLVDDGTRAVLEETTITNGSAKTHEFTAVCVGVVGPDDTDEDTDADTDADTDPPITCAPDAAPDCDGICWPVSFWGDGFCDDGTLFAPNLACAAANFDGGDCRTGS